jgi:hypothetical protein
LDDLALIAAKPATGQQNELPLKRMKGFNRGAGIHFNLDRKRKYLWHDP